MAKVQCNKDIDSLQDKIVNKNLELDQIDSMLSKAKNEYESWEKKIGIEKNNLLEVEDKISTVEDNFEKWKVTKVEEVARLKLRGKIENIDKAGLKDVLSK